jgi:hypothetical protein
MNATPHKHKALTDIYYAAPEWWDVIEYKGGVVRWVNSDYLIWDEGVKYDLRKSAKHPDNIKPKKKLIDWSKMPRGTMTNRGELIALHSDEESNVRAVRNNAWIHCSEHRSLRLAEQTEFTYWGGGECPVPEGVVVEVIWDDRTKERAVGKDEAILQWSHDTYCASNKIITAYRITGLADGWTDNPEEAV